MFLAPEELRVCEQAGELFSAFTALERLHPSDLQDVAFHIHAIQNMVMARGAQRAFPDAFNSMIIPGPPAGASELIAAINEEVQRGNCRLTATDVKR